MATARFETFFRLLDGLMTFIIDDKANRLAVVAIMALAIVSRVIAAIVIPDQSHLLVDAITYRASAVELFQHGHMASAFEMPLYPLLIAITGPGQGELAADISLSIFLVWIVATLTQELFDDRLAALFAGLMTACYPPLVFMSVVGLSETLFITLVFAAFLNWYRSNFTAASIFAVLAILTRPVFDLFAPLLVLLFALVVHRMSFVQALRRLAVYVIIYCGLMAPWWISNYQRYGSFVRLTAGGGMALYAGNNPMNHTGSGNSGVDYDLTPFIKITDPVVLDRTLRDAAVRFIVDNPIRFLKLASLKFMGIWRPWPRNEGYRSAGTIALTILSFLPILILGAIGMFLRRGMLRRLSPIYLFGLAYTGVLMIIVGTIRYRLPLEPFLIVFSGAALSELAQKVLQWRR